MYFLAIVAKDDLLRGNITPSYTLCKSRGSSDKRSPWRVYRANIESNAPKVLVKWPFGNALMIDFLSSYRTRDHMHNAKRYKYDNTKKYYPEGALFWFECNDYGEVIGPAVFVKYVPEKGVHKLDGGKRRLEESLQQTPSVRQLFSNDPFAVPLICSGVKPKLYQPLQKVCNND